MTLEDQRTIHNCCVCDTSGTDLRLIVVRDEDEEIIGAACMDCIHKEQVRKERLSQ
jgi:hypothetical protein